MNGLKVRDSKIEGKGLFADKEFNEGDVIGIAHINDVATSMIGRFHNHSDNPNAHSVSIGNKRYLAALRPLMKGEEITVDYRRQPELEQPENFKKFQEGGFVQVDRAPGNKFKKDAGGRWVYESGAPVTDTMILQELNYGKGKPIGSPVVQSAPKYEAKVPMSNTERKQKIGDLRMSPQISDQQEADRLFEVQREQDIYYPDVSDQLMRPPKNMNDLKGTEWVVNSSLGFPMNKARLAADAAAGPNDDPVDNFRHPSAGRYTAEAIADYTGNIPYISPALGFIGSNLSGIGHEVSTLISGRDKRDWSTKLKEAGEDIYNNYVGAKVGASDMTPEEKTNYLLYLSYNNLLPDGIEGGKNRKGQTNNMYFKKGPNDPGKYKSSYQEGGEPGKIRFVPGTYDPNEMAGYMAEYPEVSVERQGAPWVKYMREYEEQNPMDQFITDKKKAYLKKSGLNRAAGNNMDRIPDRVIQNFIDEYNYKKNSYVTKKYGKEAGFNPSRRGEWVDELNPTFKEKFVAESKYGSKLQPNVWDRALAGFATLASPFSPDLQAELNAGMPGLTQLESQEIKDLNIAGIPLGGLEVFTPGTIAGVNIANKLKNVGLSSGSDYKELPGLLSGEYMSNVDEGDVTGLDPIGVLSTIYSGAQLPMLFGKGAKAAAKLMNTEDGFLPRALGSSDNSLELGQASKTVYPTEEVTMAKPVSQEPWRMEPMSGLHLKATMSDGPIVKIVEPKTGLVNVEQALGIIAKESGGKEKVEMIKTALGENIPKKMDFNEFRKVVQDQLIPLEKQVVDHSSAFGLDRIGFGADINSNIPVNDTELLENKTIIFSNKNEFGRGSGAHNNPDETLGHVHYFRTSEEPEVLHISQIQSDAFQGTHRSSMKTKEQVEFSLKRMEEHYEKMKDVYEGIIKLPDGTYQLPDGQKISKSLYENMFAGQKEALDLTRSELKNFGQRQLLDKNHQERYIQEIVQSAAERGDVNRIRIPTAETAAQIQGYRKQPVDTGNKFRQLRESIIDAMDSGDSDLLDQANKVYSEEYQKALTKGELDYADEHKTILKKYKELPKTIKKLYGTEPKIVPDGKGNTWYEFNIPYEFREGSGEIKAFRRGGNISKLKKFIN